MEDNSLRILGAQDVRPLLEGQENQILEAVQSAYQVFDQGDSDLPHSIFLRFPQEPKNRIIGLPSYLGEDLAVAGMKWIASFPGNHEKGLDRASAVVVLNSASTGRPKALLEGSLISAKRTAASAALGAKHLHAHRNATAVGLIGCGLINLEIFTFLSIVFPQIQQVHLYDLMPERADAFKTKCEEQFEGKTFTVAPDYPDVFANSDLIAFATTAKEPYVSKDAALFSGKTILHISLRDLMPELVLSSINVADDVDHVCRAQTSIHLTEQQVGNRDFIPYQLADFLLGRVDSQQWENETLIFHPFGLGVLDLSVSEMVYRAALKNDIGTLIPGFLPEYWLNR